MQQRERYAVDGPEQYGAVELLALVLGTGAAGRSTRAIAADLLDKFDGVHGLAHAPVEALTHVSGVGLARAVRVHAACALARRGDRAETAQITEPRDAERVLAGALRGLPHEELHALYLARRGRLLAHRRLTRGNDRLTIVDPRQVLRPAVQLGAVAVVLGHNHPSGDPTPSAQDLACTERVGAAAAVLGVQLVDHVVVGATRCVSLAAEGLLPNWGSDVPLFAKTG
jgi:DNA repair protein RadC